MCFVDFQAVAAKESRKTISGTHFASVVAVAVMGSGLHFMCTRLYTLTPVPGWDAQIWILKPNGAFHVDATIRLHEPEFRSPHPTRRADTK